MSVLLGQSQQKKRENNVFEHTLQMYKPLLPQ